MAPSWWGCLCDVCFASKKPSEREIFIPTRTDLGFKLLSCFKENFLLQFLAQLPPPSHVPQLQLATAASHHPTLMGQLNTP